MSLNQLLTKPVVSAGIAAVSLPWAIGGKEFLFQGRSYPLWVLGVLLGGMSSFAAEIGHAYLLPHIPHGTAKIMQMESLVLSLGLSGGAFVVASKLINNALRMEEAQKLFAVGAVTEVLSSYITTNLVGAGTI